MNIFLLWIISISYNIGVIARQKTTNVKPLTTYETAAMLLFAPFVMVAHIGHSLENLNNT